jgi:hypothetical protein
MMRCGKAIIKKKKRKNCGKAELMVLGVPAPHSLPQNPLELVFPSVHLLPLPRYTNKIPRYSKFTQAG